MDKLFSTFTPENLWLWLFGLVIVLYAFKNFLEQFDFFKGRISKQLRKEAEHQEQLESIVSKIELISAGQDKIGGNLDRRFSEINENFSNLETKVNILMNSDKENTKQYIVNEYSRVMAEGWIDPKSFEIIMHKYNYYKQEGGNSFVHEIIDDIKRLPKTPPRSVYEILRDPEVPPVVSDSDIYKA